MSRVFAAFAGFWPTVRRPRYLFGLWRSQYGGSSAPPDAHHVVPEAPRSVAEARRLGIPLRRTAACLLAAEPAGDHALRQCGAGVKIEY